MTKEVQPKEAARRIEKALDKRIKDTPSLKPVLDPFKELLVERAFIKGRISDRHDIQVSAPDIERFAEGEPLLTTEAIASLIDPWGETVKSTIAPLEKAFPKIRPELTRLTEALDAGNVDLRDCIGALVGGEDEELDSIAPRLGIQPPTLRFLLVQILKPFLEKRSRNFQGLIKTLPWHRGYCPMCGSLPELSFLNGKEGQRWLRCSLCSYEWQFKKTECPYCGYEGKKGRELTYVEGRKREWAELCSECHKYIVGIDLGSSTEADTEAAAPGLVYLDILAQEKGFTPIAVCAWNVIDTTK
jgi:FdhE protein